VIEPTITFVTAGTLNYDDVIEVEIEDATSAFVTATWGSNREVIYDGAFGTAYQSAANVADVDGMAETITLTIRRDGGWPASAVTIRVIAFGDTDADESHVYPVTVEIPVDTTYTPTISESEVGFKGALDWQLDADGDLDFTGGDINFTSGAAGVAQAIQIRLRSFRGEWFANLDNGVPWFESILVKNPNIPEIKEYIRQAIMDAPFVLRLTSLELDYNRAERTLSVDWRVLAGDQTTVEGTTELEI
jgi:hypothetical protein